jgi:hypothetical protein
MIKKGFYFCLAFFIIWTASAQAQVDTYQKISDTQGNFNGTLDNEDFLGSDLTYLGDVDNDNIPDLAVGAPADDDGGDGRGAVWILFLNSSGTVKSYQKISSIAGSFTGTLDNSDQFGSSCAGVGDLDGDTVPDLAVGAVGDDDSGDDRGALWILFLNSDGTVKSHQKISDTTGNFNGTLIDHERFGSSCSSINDLDGDNVIDLAVGAYGDKTVWILFLNADGTVKSHQEISDSAGGFTGAIETMDYFGWSCAGTGDLNRDTVPDLAVGTPGDDDGGTSRGAVWILFLNSDGTVKSHQKISDTEGEFTGALDDIDAFGSALLSPGSLYEETIPVLGVGAQNDDDGGNNRGAVWLLYLSSDGTVIDHQKISDTEGHFSGGLAEENLFGFGLTIVGCLDGDEIPEIAVGAPGDADGGSNRGAAWILYSCPPPPVEGVYPENWTHGVSPAGITLDWDDIPEADSYDVYVGVDFPPSTRIADNINQSQCDTGPLPPCSSVHWMVIPNVDCSFLFGDIWTFLTGGAVPGVPENPYPADGAVGADINLTLDWDDVPDALNYDLYFGTANPPGLAAAGLTSSEYTPPELELNTQYFWFVVAHKICWETVYGPVWDFTSHNGWTISGEVVYDGAGLENAALTGLPDNPTTDDNGVYSAQVAPGWSGTVVPAFSGYSFDPTQRVYNAVGADQSGQNYTAEPASDNAPTSYQVLPEVIWAGSGGGTWMTEVQITDLTGGSVVSVYFNSIDGTRRGPITIWNNTGGSSNASRKIDNILQLLGYIDPYYSYGNNVGALEFITQDTAHAVQVTARTKNGDYSKTFPGLNLTEDNTAAVGRPIMVQNLVTNSTYRTAAGLFNPTDDSITVGIDLINAGGSYLGSTFSFTLSGHEYKAFNPFDEAGVTGDRDNIWMHILPISGDGKVMAFGATANQATNDPAAHLAKQVHAGSDIYNGPDTLQVLPEVIWASSGGGSWMTEVQITDLTGGSVVDVYFNPGGGVRRGPYTLWNNSAAGSRTSLKIANLLEFLDTIDSGYDYSNKAGAVEFHTQNSNKKIQVSARTLNGNFSKTFPGFRVVEENAVSLGESLMVQNLVTDTTYRTAFGAYNPAGNSVTAEFGLLDSNGNLIGSAFSKTLAGNEFQAFNPFTEAGASGTYDNVIIVVSPTSGSGQVMVYGATANQNTNDPAAHFAVKR